MRPASPRLPLPALALALVACTFARASAVGPVSTQFESPPVHPVEMSPDGTRLFVAHTAGHEVAVFDLTAPGGPVRIGAIPVGYEPVTVRARTDDEIWVVSHVSDAVNIVDVSDGNVVRTLLPGDEPTDVAFSESAGRAFVVVSQEDRLASYDLSDLTLAPTSIPLDQSDPRSLAVSADGSTVYVVALDSQNETTTVPFATVQANGGLPAPNPPMDSGLPAAPDVGLIVRYDGTAWRDETGASWSSVVPYTLLDHDVIAVDAATEAVTGWYRGVGTTLFNIAVQPGTGALWVTNQEASNEVRFEPNLQGQFLQDRVTTIDPGTGTVTPVHLNAHINYGNPAGDATERSQSLAIPLDLTFDAAGATAYVVALGSAKVGVLDSGGNVTRRIPVGQGPAGLALDETRNRLYVMNRFPSTLSVVDLTDDSSYEIPLGFDPSNADIADGRHFLYDAETTSAHGDLACASCHLFGTFDGLAWDLGDPQGTFIPSGGFGLQGFHPMKGPMTTQSLKGLAGTEPLHWRGDMPSFQGFNPAFQSLMGAPAQLSSGDMQAFETFVDTMAYPPNPYRNLDGSLPSAINGADPVHGETLYQSGGLVGGINCVDCHALPTGENGLIIPAQLLQEDQDMVVPQLRNMYEKTRFDNTAATNVRGFGYTHDGNVDDLFSFLQFPGFTFSSDSDREDVVAFLLAFDTGVSAAVGAQWTMDGTNEAAGTARVNTLVSEADAGRIGLIAKGRDGAGLTRGWEYTGGGVWLPDRAAEPSTDLTTLLADAGPGTELTFTAVLPGEEHRLGIDRDDDTWPDRDELDVGADPEDPLSTPQDAVGAPLPLATGPVGDSLRLAGANPTSREARLAFRIAGDGPARLEIFDVTGRRVQTLVDLATQRAGDFQRTWDLRDATGRRVSAGLYFVRLTTSRGTADRRVVVLR